MGMDSQPRDMAPSALWLFDAESHADRQLEESIKRTKMSAIRTGLAITTFSIVMLNLWTNRKQSQQIDDINRNR